MYPCPYRCSRAIFFSSCQTDRKRQSSKCPTQFINYPRLTRFSQDIDLGIAETSVENSYRVWWFELDGWLYEGARGRNGFSHAWNSCRGRCWCVYERWTSNRWRESERGSIQEGLGGYVSGWYEWCPWHWWAWKRRCREGGERRKWDQRW